MTASTVRAWRSGTRRGRRPHIVVKGPRDIDMALGRRIHRRDLREGYARVAVHDDAAPGQEGSQPRTTANDSSL